MPAPSNHDLKTVEVPLTGWRLDKVQRFVQHGSPYYEVHLIRTVDGATVYGINDSFGRAWWEAIGLAEAKTND